MNKYKSLVTTLFLACILIISNSGFAQITSSADAKVPTEYQSGLQDEIHVFCGLKGESKAALTANAPNGETATFEWSKFNGSTFDVFQNESGTSSMVTNLGDGGYRVKVTSASGENTYTAWVFNNYKIAEASIPESNCDYFTLKGEFESPEFVYTDLSTGREKELFSDVKVKWTSANTELSSSAEFMNYNPQTKDTDYEFEVYDRFGCQAVSEISYTSIVTKASFDYKLENQDKKSDPGKTEAPLTVTFTNQSENGDIDQYEWFIFKDLQQIKEEIANGVFKDSIMERIYSENPVFTFEACGSYMVKLVSKKKSELHMCTDTFYMPDYITIDTSFIEAPNVFTPNGDGINDKFAIKFFSMKTVKVTILNRWGKVIHTWESNNVQGFYPTAASIPQSVWDGKIGGQYASPGVYYYVVEGVGRDDKKRKETGFFHLFRDK